MRAPLAAAASSSISEALSLLDRSDRNAQIAVYAALLRRCSAARALVDGRRVHSHISSSQNSSSVSSSVFLANLAIQMYDKCGALEEAKSVFDSIASKNAHSWGLIMSAYARKGHYREALDVFSNSASPDEFMVAAALGACSALRNLQYGTSIHARMTAGKLPSNLVVQTALLNMYARCRSIEDAKKVFDSLAHKDAVSWNSMVAAYAQLGHSREAVQLYNQMCLHGEARPDVFTFSTVLAASSSLRNIKLGRQIHSALEASGLELDDALSSSLVHMYTRCCSLADAESVFRQRRSGLVAWTAMVTAYAQVGHPLEALEVFHRMPQVNHVSFIGALGACSSIGEPQGLVHGRSVCSMLTSTSCSNQLPEVLNSALINMYAKCGSIDGAKAVFDGIPEACRGLVSWNTMLGAYAQSGNNECLRALNLFGAMGTLGTLQPDEITFANVLTACGKLQDLQQGKAVAAHIRTANLMSLPSMKIALLNMYARCGNIIEARRSFSSYRKQFTLALKGWDLETVENMSASWNAVISAFASYGHAGQAITALRKMELEGLQPNHITFLSVLAACSRGGKLKEGRRRFLSMQEDHGIRPNVDHYRCMIQLLGRVKRLERAEELVENMEFEPSEVEWIILLGTCRAYGNYEIGKRAAKKAMKINPQNKTPLVLLSNINYVDKQKHYTTRKGRIHRPDMKVKQKIVTGGVNWTIKPLWFRFKHKGLKFTSASRNWRYSVKNARSNQLDVIRMPKLSSFIDPEVWTG